MTLGERIQSLRKQAGLTQEQLADKLYVSRQAITKWESDGGTPDVNNLKAIATLFNVSVDELLDENSKTQFTIIKEVVDLSQYEKEYALQTIYNVIIKDKFPNATITQLFRQKQLSLKENVLDFVVGSGILNTADRLSNNTADYLVEKDGRKYLVTFLKDEMETREVPNHLFNDTKTVFEKNIYKKALQTIK